MVDMPEEIEKAVRNSDKARIIRESHAIRKELLEAIRRGDVENALKFFDKANTYITEDTIDIIKRIEGNKLRSTKNLILSHNSMYALAAEYGGLDSVLSHYISEKYAILIEEATTLSQLNSLHKEFLKDYSSPNKRVAIGERLSLSYQVSHYLSNNFMNQLEIQQIANEFFVTKEHLMRTFKKEQGKTINEVIKEKRLKESLSLLRLSNLSITDIATMVGFNSVQYFSKVFKTTYGVTPTEYQKSNNNH